MGIGLRVLKKNLFTTFVFNLFEISFELAIFLGRKLDRVQVEAVRDGENVVTLCVGATPEQVIGLSGFDVGDAGDSECGIDFQLIGFLNAGSDTGVEGEAAFDESGFIEEKVGIADGVSEMG